MLGEALLLMMMLLLMMRVRRMHGGICTVDDGKVGYMTMGSYNITTWILRLGFNFNLRVFDSLEQFESLVAFPN